MGVGWEFPLGIQWDLMKMWDFTGKTGVGWEFPLGIDLSGPSGNSQPTLPFPLGIPSLPILHVCTFPLGIPSLPPQLQIPRVPTRLGIPSVPLELSYRIARLPSIPLMCLRILGVLMTFCIDKHHQHYQNFPI